MAGLVCARRLHDSGVTVQLFEKSRGLGGRLATRRGDGFQFDHGAQYATARSEPFAAFLTSMKARNATALWSPRISGNDVQSSDRKERYVGQPGMSALVRPLAEGLTIKSGVQIQSLEACGQGWTVLSDDAVHHGPFDAVVITAPAPQAAALVATAGADFEELNDVSIAPCWAGLFAFGTKLDIDWDATRNSEGVVNWAARDSSKPGRADGLDCWVIHASPEWSRDNLEADKADIARRLFDLFQETTGKRLPNPSTMDAHRWRYALVEKPLGRPCLQSADGTLIAAGDWCIAPRVEAAFQSGQAAADALLMQ